MTHARRIFFRNIAVIALVVLPFLLVPFTAYREWGFVCEATASRKGHREWFGMWKTRDWYQMSVVETFIRTNAPAALVHNWVSYMGTGYNIYGMKTLHGHARPSRAAMRFDYIRPWFERLTDSEKRAFYDFLLHADKREIEKKVESIMLDELQ